MSTYTWMKISLAIVFISKSQNRARQFGSSLITAPASQELAAGTINTRAFDRSGTAPCLRTAACLARGQCRQTDSADRSRTNYIYTVFHKENVAAHL